jgi:uncharacterized protein (DUF433 family)
MPGSSIYGGRDPRELPAYTIADAARYLHVPAATLRSWFVGRTYPRQQGVGSFRRLISPADERSPRVSFFNVVEAHVLRALRTEHGVSIRVVRPALDYAEAELGIKHVLLSEELSTGAGELFLDHYGQLINLSRSGQLAMRRVLEAYLRRVERDDRHIPVRLYPFLGSSDEGGARSVVIDPRVSFGRPVVAGSGITTEILVRRIDAGEEVADLARDYGLSAEQIEDAVVFEKAA